MPRCAPQHPDNPTSAEFQRLCRPAVGPLTPQQLVTVMNEQVRVAVGAALLLLLRVQLQLLPLRFFCSCRQRVPESPWRRRRVIGVRNAPGYSL